MGLSKGLLLISQSVRGSLVGMVSTALQRVLTRMQLTDAQLGRLIEAFEDEQHSKVLSRTEANPGYKGDKISEPPDGADGNVVEYSDTPFGGWLAGTLLPGVPFSHPGLYSVTHFAGWLVV